MRILLATVGICAGAFAIVFGEFDDSPGLQGLGLLLILFIVFRLYRGVKKSRN